MSSSSPLLPTDLSGLPEQIKSWRPVLRCASDVAAYADTLFSDFETAFAEAPHRTTIEIAGQVFEIASDIPDQIALAQHALAGQPTKAAPSGQLLIAGGGGLPSLPPVPHWEDHRYNDYRLCQKFEPTDLRLYHYRERDFWQFYDRASSRGVQMMASPFSIPDWDPGSPLRNLLRWHLTNAEQGFVHAGTLGVAGHGLMLAGPGGSGKSGTVLAGLLAGMQSVGDDYILARTPAAGGVSVAPIFNTLKNDPAGLERLGVGRNTNVDLKELGYVNWQGKHQFTFQDLVQRNPVSQMHIEALCVPMVTGGNKTEITPMPRREAFLALAQTGFKQMPGDTRHSLNFCSELIKRLPTYRLSLGTEPDEIIDSLRHFLEQLTHDSVGTDK